ncbi:MAG: hypothetical protein IT331_12410 [Anaerolineae bacterium]|nr:hypothetical protein [Anaerolineae bacterium]
MRNALDSRLVQIVLAILVGFLVTCLTILVLDLFRPPRPLAQLLPTPTATRRPPPTITPVAYPPTPPLALREDFTDRTGFPDARGVRLGYEYTDDGYLLTPPLDPGFVRALNQKFTESGYLNLSLEAMAAPAENSGPVEYGIVFWHGEDEQGRERFLAFTISSGSTIRLLSYEPADENDANAYKFTDVIPMAQTQAIHLDGSLNKIRVDAHPRRILAYVNDELVLDTDASIINEWRVRRDWDGRVGVIAFTMDEPGAQALFTQFDIYADAKAQ